MPPSSKSTMSLAELATCEDFLDGHREYATDLLSSIEKIKECHSTESCSETRRGRTCTTCDIYSTGGLIGATKKALASYEDAECHLKRVRASLGKKAPRSRGAPAGGETLFTSELAKAVFLCIAAVGDDLRSQHESWRERLQSEVTSWPPSTPNSKRIDKSPNPLDDNEDGSTLLPAYSGPKFVRKDNPKLAAVPPGWVPDRVEATSNSSALYVFRRCLSPDCPCEANRANVAANAKPRGANGSTAPSTVPSLPSDSQKARKSKATQNKNTRRLSKKANDTSEALAVDPPILDTPDLQGVTSGKNEPSSSASGTALLTSFSPSIECEMSIQDPRIPRLRVQVTQSDDTRLRLMQWCRAAMAELQLDPLDKDETRPTNGSARTTCGHRFAPTVGSRTVKRRKPLCVTSQPDDEDLIKGNGGDATTQEKINPEQEELKRRWIKSRQRRCKEQKC